MFLLSKSHHLLLISTIEKIQMIHIKLSSKMLDTTVETSMQNFLNCRYISKKPQQEEEIGLDWIESPFEFFTTQHPCSK